MANPIPMHDVTKKRALPWIGLCCILAIYLVTILRLNPLDLFGAIQDDSLYFSSAKAIANQQGYILPSVPGQPVATKYPILYPWMLSWVWRLNPSFPSNLTEAVALTAAFGVLFLASSFIFLRRQKGIGDIAALGLTFFIALHPFILLYSGAVLSDIPFAALAFTAMLVADEGMQPNARGEKTAASAILTGLSILTRGFGIPVAVGILAAAVARRAWRQIAIYCAVLVPFASVNVWRWIFAPHMAQPSVGSALRGPGFVNAWTYYMSYGGFWKISVPNTQILWKMLKNNAVCIIHAPSDYFLAPMLTRDTIWSLALMFLVMAAIFAGLVRQSRDRNWKSIHCALPFYLALILIWNYPDTGRYLLLFLPLFASGLFYEIKRFLTFTYTTISKSRDLNQRVLAGVIGFGVLAVICALAVNYAKGGRQVTAEIVSDRAALLSDKLEAYQWLSCCTAHEDVVIAYEDASLYLYTGRYSMRPIAFPTSVEYDPAYLQDSLAHMTDVAHALGARYWLISDDDFDLEWGGAAAPGHVREKELEQRLPVAFQSHGGHIRIYKIACTAGSDASACL